MTTDSWDARVERESAALHRLLYAESVGLPADAAQIEARGLALADLYAEKLGAPRGQALDASEMFALEGWADARRLRLDQQVTEAMDRCLRAPSLQCSAGELTWRNWKVFEREVPAGDVARLAEGLERLVEQSAELRPLLQARLEQTRADYGAYGLTPAQVYAWREGMSLESLAGLMLRLGRACSAPFRSALDELSQTVFRRPAGPAELRALLLNRMYEPLAGLFRVDGAVAEALAAFRDIGFDLSAVPVDVENRPRKYPGAFCYTVSTPGDVRVSVRITSAHHLVDMLYHELGHAAHFSGIRADLPFLDREWMRSGTHETFSTLFECLLGEPAFLRERFGFDGQVLEQLLAFHRFKMLLVGTWYAALGLTAVETWAEVLDWPQVEARFAARILDFTGVAMPAGFARLEAFASALAVYPAGYALAAVRVAHWLEALRGLGGEAWWHSPAAQADIRQKIRLGGSIRFPDAWQDPEIFLDSFGTNKS